MSVKSVVGSIHSKMKAGKKKHRIEIRQADDDSFIVNHRIESPDQYDPGTESTHQSVASVKKHVGGILEAAKAHSGKPVGKMSPDKNAKEEDNGY